MKYRLQQLTASAASSIELDELKIYLRIDSDSDDEMLRGMITAARNVCETRTRRVFKSTQFKMLLDDFPSTSYGMIELPRSPLISVDSVKYYDTDGTFQTLATTVYEHDDGIGVPARIFTKPSQVWPTTQAGKRNAVEITFTCGYQKPGTSETLVPEELNQAMRLIIGHWYENREDSIVGMAINQIPKGADYLLDSVRIVTGVTT